MKKMLMEGMGGSCLHLRGELLMPLLLLFFFFSPFAVSVFLFDLGFSPSAFLGFWSTCICQRMELKIRLLDFSAGSVER